MRRGDIVVVSLPGDFGKPRPAIVIQSDALAGLDTVVVCPLTTHLDPAIELRPTILPSTANGLREPSEAMVDKVMTYRLKRIADPIGRLIDADVAAVDRALAFVLDLRTSTAPR